MSTSAPLCFVMMPFGKKTDVAGLTVDFDAVYEQVIKPATMDAGLEPLRADEEMTGGFLHRAMFERLLLCEFAVADLTTANANVFYQLGIRHAARPTGTLVLFAEEGRLPFDVTVLRALSYRLTADGMPADPSFARAAVNNKLREAVAQHADSPFYQLLDTSPDAFGDRADVFRAHVHYTQEKKEQLAQARRSGIEALAAFEESLGDSLAEVEPGLLIDLFLSYRAVRGWGQMIELAVRLPSPVAATVLIQEQLALALNRAGRDVDAEAVLQSVLARRGLSSETYGILGRVYKDRYDRAKKAGNVFVARAELEKAIETYLKGFEADWRDAYPGINAVTLMELREVVDPRQEELIPVVTYAARRRMASGKPDYWDYATLLELAVLARDGKRALEALSHAMAFARDAWEPETTLNNIMLIIEARQARQEVPADWLKSVVAKLSARASVR